MLHNLKIFADRADSNRQGAETPRIQIGTLFQLSSLLGVSAPWRFDFCGLRVTRAVKVLLFFVAWLLGIQSAVAGPAPLFAGFGECDISPKVGGNKPVFIAGFGHNRKATALHDPIMARAIVLAHDKQLIALVSVDLVGLFPAIVEAVRAELPEYGYILVSSTHNHEGPDTLGLWGASPFSSGVDLDYLKVVQAGIVKAIKLAAANRVKVQARIGSVNAPNLLSDSRLPVVLHDELVAIEFTNLETMKPHGVLVQWNCHPETLESKNTEVSADFVAATVRELSKTRQCPVAYFTGTVGGLMSAQKTPIMGPDGKPLADGSFEKTNEYGRMVARAATKALENSQAVTLTPFDVRTRAVHLPVDNVLYQLAAQVGVLKRPIYTWNDTPAPKAAQIVTDFSKRRSIKTEVGYLKLGELEVAAVPGEIYPELVLGKVENPADKGADFPDAPIEPAIYTQMKGKHRMLIGLANDEVGYLIPKRQWDEKAPFCYGLKTSQYGEINSCGPETARIVCEAFKELSKPK